MTDEERKELARRAVACKGWRWMPGMLTDSKFARVVAVDEHGAPCAAEEGATNDDCHAVWLDGVALLPDLTDAATIGCVLALVREAWGDPTLCVVLDTSDGRWCVERRCGDIRVFQYGTQGDTEAEALVAALEASPTK